VILKKRKVDFLLEAILLLQTMGFKYTLAFVLMKKGTH